MALSSNSEVYTAEETPTIIKRTTYWMGGNIFTQYIRLKRLITKIRIKSSFKTDKQKNPMIQRRHTNGQGAIDKELIITNDHGNTNQNNTEILSHITKTGPRKIKGNQGERDFHSLLWEFQMSAGLAFVKTIWGFLKTNISIEFSFNSIIPLLIPQGPKIKTEK